MARVMVGQAGPEGADRGAERLARALRDAGHEVVYTGPGLTPEQLAETAIQEDAGLIGLIAGPGADDGTVVRAVAARLADRDAADIAVRVFAGDASTDEITGWVAERRAE